MNERSRPPTRTPKGTITGLGASQPPGASATAPRSDTEIAAAMFRAFADPTRLALLLGLLDGEQRVAELVGVAGRSQATVSEHLGVLRSGGLVDARPAGRQTFYRLATPEVVELLLTAQRLLAATGEHVRLCDQHDLDAHLAGRP